MCVGMPPCLLSCWLSRPAPAQHPRRCRGAPGQQAGLTCEARVVKLLDAGVELAPALHQVGHVLVDQAVGAQHLRSAGRGDRKGA